MTFHQVAVFVIIAVALALFAWGRWRHDVVAFATLMAAVVVGVVPPGDAFSGFGHPATVTVAAVLILSRALMNAGATDQIARLILPKSKRRTPHVGAVCGLGAVLSSFMNNVGALALLMPVAMRAAQTVKQPPSIILMPLAFASILGGLMTLIGTPPNIIIAAYRGDAVGAPFQMFDFLPVGGVVAAAGAVFIAAVGWRLLPLRGHSDEGPSDLFNIEAYVTEARVQSGSETLGMAYVDADAAAQKHDLVLAGLIRRGKRIARPHRDETLKSNDVLVLEGSPKAIDAFVTEMALKIVGTGKETGAQHFKDTELIEAVVQPRSRVEGRTASSLRLPQRFDVDLLAVSREGQRRPGRLASFRFRPGDVLLLHGDPVHVAEATTRLQLLPLETRGATFGKRGAALSAFGLFVAAIAAGSLGLVEFPIALGLAVIGVVLANIVPLRDLYDAVDWPVIVLLGALIPVGAAMETTGATAVVADGLFRLVGAAPLWLMLCGLMIVTAGLSAVLNNAATAVVMAPIAVALAERTASPTDALLMAVAIAASTAFLTPVGHQNNTIVLGPGGYRFSDFARLGAPLTVVVIAVAVPMILWVWT
jgi:di/tricarboxylate transporter